MKLGDCLDVMKERAIETLRENGEPIDKLGLPKERGIAEELILNLRTGLGTDIYTIYTFAEEYGISIDWLLGRSEKNWL